MKYSVEIIAKSHVEALAAVDAPGFKLNPNNVPNENREELQVIREAVRKIVSTIPMNGHEVFISVDGETSGDGTSEGTISWRVEPIVAAVEATEPEKPVEPEPETPVAPATVADAAVGADATSDPAANSLKSGDV